MAKPVDSIQRRIRAAIGATVAIFSISIGYWGVVTNQQSQADSVTTVLHFDDRGQGVIDHNAYAAQGIYVDSSGAGDGARLYVPDTSGICQGWSGAPSQPNALVVQSGGSFDPYGLTVGFTNGRVVDSLSTVVLLTKFNNAVVTSYDIGGGTIESKVVSTGNGCDSVPVTLTKGSSTGIAKFEIKKQNASQSYAVAIDDLSFGTPHLPISNFDFTVTPASGTAPLAVTATYTGTQAAGLVLNWDFGDGQTSQNGSATVTHTYQSSGSYQIRLTSDPFSAQKTVAVSTPAPPSPAPISFSVTPLSGMAPLTVTGHSDATPTGVTKRWDWGDGSPAQDQQPLCTGIGTTTCGWADLSHTYATSGSYVVTLTQTQNGTTQTSQKTVTVTPNTADDAVLTLSKSVYDPAEPVVFSLKNVSTDPLTLPNGAPFGIKSGTTGVFSPISTQAAATLAAGGSKSWTWDQKNDAGAHVPDGPYTVTVTYEHAGTVKTKSASFTIASAPVAPTFTYSFTPTSGSSPLTVAGTVTGPDAATATWDFGDGTTATGASVSHTYLNPGTYTATVRIGSQVGTQTITVRAATSTVTTATVPSRLAQTGTSLSLALLIAFVLSGMVSYLIIRRPFHS